MEQRQFALVALAAVALLLAPIGWRHLGLAESTPMPRQRPPRAEPLEAPAGCAKLSIHGIDIEAIELVHLRCPHSDVFLVRELLNHVSFEPPQYFTHDVLQVEPFRRDEALQLVQCPESGVLYGWIWLRVSRGVISAAWRADAARQIHPTDLHLGPCKPAA